MPMAAVAAKRAAQGQGGTTTYDEEAEDAPTLPVLRRLHLASPISFDLFLHRLRPLAPGLTHVRLSELLAFDYDMARALHSELAERGAVPAQFPRLRERQWSAEPRAVPVDWERFLPPPGTLRRLVVQPAQLPPAPEQLCGCCSGYYRVDDMTRLLREMAREACDGGGGEEDEDGRRKARCLCFCRRARGTMRIRSRRAIAIGWDALRGGEGAGKSGTRSILMRSR
jgi:hypothetical protein